MNRLILLCAGAAVAVVLAPHLALADDQIELRHPHDRGGSSGRGWDRAGYAAAGIGAGLEYGSQGGEYEPSGGYDEAAPAPRPAYGPRARVFYAPPLASNFGNRGYPLPTTSSIIYNRPLLSPGWLARSCFGYYALIPGCTCN